MIELGLVLLFSTPPNQTCMIVIQKEISETGPQTVELVVEPPVQGIARYTAPDTETYTFLSDEQDYKLTITGNSAVRVTVFVIPTLRIERDKLRWAGLEDQKYTIEKTTDLQNWIAANPNRIEEQGTEAMEMNLNTGARHKMFRLKVTK